MCVAIAVGMMLGAASCRRVDRTLGPWGWERLERPTDTLMLRLQDAFLGDTPLDSCVMLVERFHDYADRSDAPAIERARATFWDARLAFATENYDEARDLFRKSLAATDSARYPFDAKYTRLCLEPLEGRVLDGGNLDWKWYEEMIDDLDYALANDAPVYGGLRAQYLCCIMTYSGNPSRALQYALLADSLFACSGRRADRLTNRLNVASTRVLVGDTVGALRDYAWIQREIESGVRPMSPLMLPLIDYNRWVEARDTAALLRLRDVTRHDPALAGYKALAAAWLADIELESGRTDSISTYLADMKQGADYTDDAAQRSFVLKMLGRGYEAMGDHRQAIESLKASADIAEENVRMLSTDKYAMAETRRITDDIERQRIADRRSARIWMWVYTSVIAALLIIAAIFLMRYLKRLHRGRQMERRDLEEARRSELSMSLSVCEKERQIEELRQKISALADEEMIDAGAAREIESSLRTSAAASKADEEFGRVFATVSPNFNQRLRQLYPRIGRNAMRMAEYIAIGMDNRHIARVMNIRPESVKQNRWRLRQALGLGADDNLDATLRDLL